MASFRGDAVISLMLVRFLGFFFAMAGVYRRRYPEQILRRTGFPPAELGIGIVRHEKRTFPVFYELDRFAKREQRDFSNALRYTAKIGLIALDNPELTIDEIEDILAQLRHSTENFEAK